MIPPSLDDFRAVLSGPDLARRLHDATIGHDMEIDGPEGPVRLLYADYVASGRALSLIERFMLERVLPFYANSHTEASCCGAAMTRLRRQARAEIARLCDAEPDCATIFCGAGATAGLNRIVHLFGVGPGDTVLLGPYEHHSNILPWRESGARVVELPESPGGGPDLEALDAELARAPGRVVAAFSAMSNITGVLTDVAEVTRRLKRAGALAVWDYAGGAPYIPVSMRPAADAPIDALVVSAHKFPGGPGASGLLILRRDAVRAQTPGAPGGGTVRFVSPEGHDYAQSLEAREEGGTPNVTGDIRAALVFMIKDALGAEFLAERQAQLRARALAAWRDHPRIALLGDPAHPATPVFSFRIRDGAGGYVHQQFFTRLLSDLRGVQARGGCACAGPYVHRLLDIGPERSAALRAAILAGREVEKPGFVRLNFSYLLSDAEADRIIDAVCDLAGCAAERQAGYRCDAATAIFSPVAQAAE